MKKARLLSKVVAIAALSLCLWLPASQSWAKGAWEWTLVPYLWVSDIGMEVTINNQPVLDTDVAFGDLLDKVDYALTAHFEGRRGKAGFLFDLTAIGLSNESTLTGTPGPPLPPDGTSIKADVDLTLLEVGGFFRPQGEKTGFDLIFGIRYIGIDQKIDITLPDPLGLQASVESSPTLTDGFLGLRYSGNLGKKWGYAFRGDVGAGGTEVTFNGLVGFSYQLGKSGKYALALGYRYMDMDIEEVEEGVRLKTDMTMSGAYAGFVIQW